jgi:thiol-disulfide isomerase/thioredoxin
MKSCIFRTLTGARLKLLCHYVKLSAGILSPQQTQFLLYICAIEPMKKTLHLILIFLCPILAFSNGFVLKGNVEGLQTGTVTLAYVNEAGEDTTLIASITGGMFTLTGKVPEPELARLTITEGWAYNISIFLENSAITLHLVKDVAEKTTVTGSASEIVYEKLNPGMDEFFEHARKNEAAHHQYAGGFNPQAIISADSLWSVQQQQWIQSIKTAIALNPENYAALYFIRWLLFKPDNYDAILSAYKQLSPAVRQGLAGKKFFAEFEHLHKASKGQPAPEISGKDTSGKAVTLAAFKGKVVLLDFWSSYCGPCRQENVRLLPIYQKYHARGFEIVSFSLDNASRFWLGAIRKDGLIWPQASDLRGGAGATAGIYDITDMPRNVLIDQTGKIYAKDIHGEDLIKALEGLLGKGK